MQQYKEHASFIPTADNSVLWAQVDLEKVTNGDEEDKLRASSLFWSCKLRITATQPLTGEVNSTVIKLQVPGHKRKIEMGKGVIENQFLDVPETRQWDYQWKNAATGAATYVTATSDGEDVTTYSCDPKDFDYKSLLCVTGKFVEVKHYDTLHVSRYGEGVAMLDEDNQMTICKVGADGLCVDAVTVDFGSTCHHLTDSVRVEDMADKINLQGVSAALCDKEVKLFGLYNSSKLFSQSLEIPSDAYLVRLFNEVNESSILYMAVAYRTEKSTALNLYLVDVGSDDNGGPSITIELEQTYKAHSFDLESLTVSDVGYCNHT